ncbi:hypothetical protein PTSG_00438 [Salpingoeca rosetta]|uniref:Uncharacterized protein n=1 Tax=Salpingoeca rosetta (strain ATCC 50818 / BSB-021) TaxID=946362 RepID=F2TWH2_SALR5|nr:uncharacterized protein PTSG_00438 [Salpingoeca rosetta]EGD72418.1 hypothetical protein PTSG_00438 [Salpingoeca rosetta]|eukprot:XP_004998987.1 hypothetical protein PTSG_00438 [Salpingoeca rosetta]
MADVQSTGDGGDVGNQPQQGGVGQGEGSSRVGVGGRKTANTKRVKDEPWQKVVDDPIADMDCTSSCITFADVNNQGENKVIVANMQFAEGKSKLQVLNCGELQQSIHLFGFPCGTISFRTSDEASAPAIAVASGNALYVFKNLKPFYKFILPDLPLDEQELETWVGVRRAERVDADVLQNALLTLRGNGVKLSPRSLKFLSLPPEMREDFVNMVKTQPATTPAVITTVGTLAKLGGDDTGVACPVLGTEDGQVFVLNPTNFAAVVRVSLPGPVACMTASGALDTDYRIHACTRDGTVCHIKGGKLADHSFSLPAPAVGIDRIGKSLLISCADSCLYCFSTKGRRLWQVKMPAPITAHSPMVYRPKMLRLTLIGLENGEIRLYSDKEMLSTLKVDSGVAALRFGRLWRDSYVLVTVTQEGHYIVHRLKRATEFHQLKGVKGPPPEQHIRIKVPTKTKLYVDQTQREKDNAVSMHQAFRRDHYVLQVLVARKYVKAMTSALAPTSALEDVKFQVGAAVQGIGPTFRLLVTVQNTSATAVSDIRLALTWDESMYDIQNPSGLIPHLVPGVTYTESFNVQCITQEMVSSPIKVQLYSPQRSLPIVTAVVAMPVSEPVVTVR